MAVEVTPSTLEALKDLVAGLKEKQNEERLAKTIGKILDEKLALIVNQGNPASVNRISSVRKGRFTGDHTLLDKAFINTGASQGDREDIQKMADEMYLCSSILGCDPRELKMWQDWEQTTTELRKAMDTATSGEGEEWIPTQLSKDLIDKVRLELKVALLHGRINMPTPTFRMPLEGADAIAYLVPEATSDDSTKIRTSTPGTKRITFVAQKLAGRVLFSEEITEDSIVPILAYLRGKVITALAVAQETCTINGDNSSTHQDSDVTDPMDARKAWDGYRVLCLAATKVDISTLTTTALRNIKKAMGKYGININQLAWITGASGYNQMLDLTEVRTVDKYGPKATILTGELAKFDNIPVIVSEFVREDLNESGVYDGTTTTKTIILLVRRDTFLYGDRRTIKVKTAEIIETDQSQIVTTQRLDFQSTQDATTERIIGMGYNLTS
jgi:HK97 family phage major capsid protein